MYIYVIETKRPEINDFERRNNLVVCWKKYQENVQVLTDNLSKTSQKMFAYFFISARHIKKCFLVVGPLLQRHSFKKGHYMR